VHTWAHAWGLPRLAVSALLPLLAGCTTGSQVTGQAVDPRPFGDVNTVPFGEAAKPTKDQTIDDATYHAEVETLMAEATTLHEKGRVLWEATFKESRVPKTIVANEKENFSP